MSKPLKPQHSLNQEVEGNVIDELINIRTPEITFKHNVLQYIVFLYTTWSNFFWSTPYLVFTPLTWISELMFASVSSLVMFILLFVCSILNVEWIKNLVAPSDVSWVNAAHPDIFKSLTKEIKDAAFKTMSDSHQRSNANVTVFELEVSKLLLVISALTYEAGKPGYGFDTAHGRLSNSTDAGGAAYERAAGHKKAEKARQALIASQRRVAEIAKEDLDLRVEPLSVLSTQTASLATAFWNEEQNFIVLAFKGTNPAEFSEWLIDFTNTYSEQVDYLKGYKGIHRGFYDQVFTPPSSGYDQGVLPYDSICKGIKKIAANLQETNGGKQVNMFVTGHSLGCGLASVFFARAQANPHELGKDDNGKNLVAVRDAYLFAAPIFGDYDSKVAYNQSTRGKGYDKPSIIWRVTNKSDIVATGLPHGGDHQTIGNQFGQRGNLLNFAHIGQEIRMKPFSMIRKFRSMEYTPVFSEFGPGTLLSPHSKVKIYSDLPNRGIGPKVELAWYYQLAENLPFVGRFVSHGTSFYWASLTQIGATEGKKEKLPPAKHGWF